MKIGIIDIETTNFFPKGFIVEVGIASLDTDTGEVEKVFDSVCREPGMTAKDHEAWIFSNSDLTIEMVREAKLLDDLKSEIQAVLDTFDAVTAYNKKFDLTFIRDRGFIVDNEWPCPMLVSTDICKLPDKRGNKKWPKVPEAWQFFFPNEPYVELHRGADDAVHEAHIVYQLYLLGVMAPVGESAPVDTLPKL